MRCNLNFNGCNAGPSYPCPIFTCRSLLLRALTPSTTTIVNPPIVLTLDQLY